MGKKQHIDHLGNIFESRNAMCAYWNIPTKTYEQRHAKKWTMEECLTTPIGCKPGTKPYIDHLGNSFSSMSAMAEYWHIPSSTLQSRICNKHMSIKDALTLTEKEMHARNTQCYDHKGQIFESQAAMCQYWNIPRQVYFGRLKLGWTLEQVLETPLNYVPKNSKTVTDHEGNTFDSISKMCKYWNMTRSTYNARIKNGWSIKDALTTPKTQINVTKQKWTDHLGNEFESMNAMCNHYGVTHHTFKTRLDKLGWSLEDALTKSNVINSKEIIDYKNRKFPTIADFCHFYGLPSYQLQGKNISANILNHTMKKAFHAGVKITDNITIVKALDFPYYLVSQNNHDIILTFEQILDVFHNHDFMPFPPSKLTHKNMEIKTCIQFPYYEITLDDQTYIWTYWQLIQYRHDTNFGLSQ